MPVNTSGRIVKTRKGKKGTMHQKNHRWESFTTKISKFNSLDPIRRVRHHDIDTEDLSTTTSYLRAGLDKWAELNMSEGFILFSREMSDLTESLPQIIYSEDKIMALFVTYMEKRERESLEPLLELLTDFAHDLGARFEKHYPKSLEMIISIAGMLQDVAVIEWSFTSLAFLFKYLSKLLVPDLRPTYSLMAPLLGKQRQKPHIARFAGEAMSFLIKKAGAPAHRTTALPLIVKYAKDDLNSIQGTKEFGLYYHGIMTLFAEAMKGNGLSVHTTGPAIFKSLFLALEDSDLDSSETHIWMNVICGVLTSVIHHGSSDTFPEILDVVLENAASAAETFEQDVSKQNLRHLLLSARTLGIAAGVRKGTRVRNWTGLLNAMALILKSITKNASFVIENEYADIWKYLILSISITFQYAPMDTLIGFISPAMDALTKDPLMKWFLTFCAYLSEVDADRFRSIALPYFKKFIVAHWSDENNGDTFSVLLPKMVLTGVLPSRYGKDGFPLPRSWQDQIVSKFERLEVQPFPEQSSPYDRSPATWHDRCLPKYNALLEVLDCTVVHPATNARIAEILQRKLKLALRPSSSLAPEEANFIVGRGFSSFSRMTKGAGAVDRSLEPLLRAAAPRYARLPNFLEALLAYETSIASSPEPKAASPTKDMDSDTDDDLLITSLISNLSTGSHDLRYLSLRLLDHIYTTEHGTESQPLSIMIMVENSTLDPQAVRSASMHIRKLATMYANEPAESWVKQAIPSFYFGMLTVKLRELWDQVAASLRQIAESKSGDEAVAKLAFEWLEKPSMTGDEHKSLDEDKDQGMTDFECSNLMKLDKLAEEADSGVAKSRDTMLQKFAEAQELVSAQPKAARAQALMVLSAATNVAEKRSRLLVPMFLSWAKSSPEIDQADEEEEQRLSDWTRNDQKALLNLFAQFGNPKSLFRSEDVYNALLQLLANGDIEIQKSALKAIFAWKNPSIRPYEENLLNLLDEARFKEEIAILLQGKTLVQAEHRPSLMPVLLRVIYGRSISRKGAASGRQGMEARRLTILRNLGKDDMEGFLDIALGELANVQLLENGTVRESLFDIEVMNVRKQVGFTHMIEGMLKELATKVVPIAGKLIDAVLYCVIYASRQLHDEPETAAESVAATTQISLLKVVRQTGLKCLVLLFNHAPDFVWSPYMNIISKEIISPRLENLPIETGQGASVILRLFSTWAISPKLVFFLTTEMLSKVAECLAPPKSKDEVKRFVLKDIIQKIIGLSREDVAAEAPAKELSRKVKDEILTPSMDSFLIQIGSVLRTQGDMGKELLESCIGTVSDLAPFVTTSTQAQNLVDVSIFLLDQPTRRVKPKEKGALLVVLEHFVPLYDLQNNPELKDRVYNTVTSLFGFFKDNASRQGLSRVLMVYAENDKVMGDVAELCMGLNSFLGNRLDEPDYDRRIKAFNKMNVCTDFTVRQWTPLLYNMLFYITHDEESGILSSNSSDSLCQFISTAHSAQKEKDAFMALLSSVLMPALYTGARHESELIRREYLKVMAKLVETFPEWPEVSDMKALGAEPSIDDNESEPSQSFFESILDIGKGRRPAALKRLSDAAESDKLGSKNVAHFLIPLLEHFIFDKAEGNDASQLASEASTTIGVLAGCLEWPQYRALLRRYIGYIESKDQPKQMIRLLGKVLDALSLDTPATALGDEVDVPEAMEVVTTDAVKSRLTKTMPKVEKFAEDITSNILPPLTTYLHDKDESTVSLRVPVAIIVVRLLKLLPREQLTSRLPAVLTDVCHILRSKAAESRKMTRDTLVKICVLLGPTCIGFVLKELRSSLQRGYQVHVLSFTMHSILVATTPDHAPGDLDYCLGQIVDIITDDIFGNTGQEKDAEEYTSKMEEVRSSKSYDSMELIASTATLSRLTDLVTPIRKLLQEKLNIKMVRKADQLLNRISNGLQRNRAADSRESLIFCYEVIQDANREQKPNERKKVDHKLKKYLTSKGARRGLDRGSTTVYTFKIVRFAFDVLRAVLKKHDGLRTAKNLTGFIPVLGDAVVEAEEEVRVSAFKTLTAIVQVPLVEEANWTNLYRVAAAEATKAIIESPQTDSDIAQAGLKLISNILRFRPDVKIKDTAVDNVLGKLRQDITEPERRNVTFDFLRAALDSKVETAVVYDVMDFVGEQMVTNFDKETRIRARGAFFQFLSEYPQQKARWSKQLKFIVANLNYAREGGRLTVLELIYLLLKKTSKSSPEIFRQIATAVFKPLYEERLNSEESDKCRVVACDVLREIFAHADPEQTNALLGILRNGIRSDDEDIVRVSFQTFRLYYDSNPSDDSDVSLLMDRISIIGTSAEDPGSDMGQIFEALLLSNSLAEKFPSIMFSKSSSQSFWTIMRACLSYPHEWVKLSASKLFNYYFDDFARKNADTNFKLPLKGSGGLRFTGDDIQDLIRRTTYSFNTPAFSNSATPELMSNIKYLARWAAANNLKWRNSQTAEDEEDEAEDEKEDSRTALRFLFSRLSFLLRKEISPPRLTTLLPRTNALALLQSLVLTLPTDSLHPALQLIIQPLHHITDPNIPTPYSTDEAFRAGYEDMKTSAEALLESVKRKAGIEAYSEALLEVAKRVKKTREERRAKRKIEAVSAPEKAGKDKARKTERKKERRKEKGAEYQAKRHEQ
ncbi:related to papaya ringspot virus polyprotein [Rhynchosporium secalis]|uniref:Related to papaya ringspot virus polyprotein n=1 Tax=Rhynchosporium secalis TaxID=38038 RepID=A0A1E1MDM1_RHYSE|nr:related to papaya ringspot virus polyprotein [Rhynchosporium secalis]